MDCGTLEGKSAILDGVKNALSVQDCAAAVALIDPVYNSGCTDDEVRFARASAYGCAANINFFKLIGDLLVNDLAASGFWITMTMLFPSVTTDTRVTAGQGSTDSLMAIRKPGAITALADMIGINTFNPGSLIAVDRHQDANAYLMFVSMSLIGSLQNRYSSPNPSTFRKTQVVGYSAVKPQGWAVATNVDLEGCTYASAILNLLDAVNDVSQNVSGNMGTILSQVGSTFTSGINLACDLGCRGAGGYLSGCSLPAGSCNPCPTALRNRTSCTGADEEKVSCAAAGIAHFINTDATNGWPN